MADRRVPCGVVETTGQAGPEGVRTRTNELAGSRKCNEAGRQPPMQDPVVHDMH